MKVMTPEFSRRMEHVLQPRPRLMTAQLPHARLEFGSEPKYGIRIFTGLTKKPSRKMGSTNRLPRSLESRFISTAVWKFISNRPTAGSHTVLYAQ